MNFLRKHGTKFQLNQLGYKAYTLEYAHLKTFLKFQEKSGAKQINEISILLYKYNQSVLITIKVSV